MKKLILVLVAVLTLAAVGVAHTPSAWNIIFAREAPMIEIEVNNAGEFQQIEYGYDHTRVPATIQQAMRVAYPTMGPFTGAKRAMIDNATHYALLGQVNGLPVEVMFDTSAGIEWRRVEVPANLVPQRVRTRVQSSPYAGVIHQWLAIQDAADQTTEYHARTENNGRRYRVEVSPAGQLRDIYYETVAELEIPVR